MSISSVDSNDYLDLRYDCKDMGEVKRYIMKRRVVLERELKLLDFVLGLLNEK